MNTMSRLLISASFLIVASETHAVLCGFEENKGTIQRLYIHPSHPAGPGTFFRLKNGVTNALSPDGYYHIPALDTSTSQPPDSQALLYRSMHDLLIEAAKAGWTVKVRTTDCTYPQSVAKVQYLVIDY